MPTRGADARAAVRAAVGVGVAAGVGVTVRVGVAVRVGVGFAVADLGVPVGVGVGVGAPYAGVLNARPSVAASRPPSMLRCHDCIVGLPVSCVPVSARPEQCAKT
ncbi:hypothetical protein CGZ96_11410 [Enemella evansiae]|nr:hypothetical protein CGZ96_11410 [Enemella evansiae]